MCAHRNHCSRPCISTVHTTGTVCRDPPILHLLMYYYYWVKKRMWPQAIQTSHFQQISQLMPVGSSFGSGSKFLHPVSRMIQQNVITCVPYSACALGSIRATEIARDGYLHICSSYKEFQFILLHIPLNDEWPYNLQS